MPGWWWINEWQRSNEVVRLIFEMCTSTIRINSSIAWHKPLGRFNSWRNQHSPSDRAVQEAEQSNHATRWVAQHFALNISPTCHYVPLHDYRYVWRTRVQRTVSLSLGNDIQSNCLQSACSLQSRDVQQTLTNSDGIFLDVILPWDGPSSRAV